MNLKRIRKLIDKAISELELDLGKLIVLTEMGSSYYMLTPIIAALAGATKVFAVVKDSPYGKKQDIAKTGMEIADRWDVAGKIETRWTILPSVVGLSDIITNLGFVRPINAKMLEDVRRITVVPYMREAWEYRRDDVDIEACNNLNIPVIATNEGRTFGYCGPLAVKMLLDANIEVFDARVIVISNDKFGTVISKYLEQCGAYVMHVRKNWQLAAHKSRHVDAIIVACQHVPFVNVGALVAAHPECTLITFSERGKTPTTLAALGPKPVIDLHTKGLKVGELMHREMRKVKDCQKAIDNLEEHELCVKMQI